MFHTQSCKNYIICMSSSLRGSSPQYGWNSGCKSTAHTAPVLCLQSKRELLMITCLWRPWSLGKLAEIVVLWPFFRQMSTRGWDGNPMSRIWWNSQSQRTDTASDSFSSAKKKTFMIYAAYKTLADIEKNNPQNFNLWKRIILLSQTCLTWRARFFKHAHFYLKKRDR